MFVPVMIGLFDTLHVFGEMEHLTFVRFVISFASKCQIFINDAVP